MELIARRYSTVDKKLAWLKVNLLESSRAGYDGHEGKVRFLVRDRTVVLRKIVNVVKVS